MKQSTKLGFSQEDGNIVLTTTEEDYMKLLFALGVATGRADSIKEMKSILGLVNRLNEGNPQFTPYKLNL